MKSSRLTLMSIASSISLIGLISIELAAVNGQQQQQQQQAGPFPGVARELASYCAARPSLPVDLAAMVVHVKRNTSFNYKLYLFSADHVFQTGQVIPRADFRIHSFPVKVKHISEFWPNSLPTYQYTGSKSDSLVQVQSSTFNLRQFLRRVPLNPNPNPNPNHRGGRVHPKSSHHQQRHQHQQRAPDELHGEVLPGDPLPTPQPLRVSSSRPDEHSTGDHQRPFSAAKSHDSTNLNSQIQFDRDDQVSAVARRAPDSTSVYLEGGDKNANSASETLPTEEFVGDSIIPVGAFSSFHVDLTYLVRKDFDQVEPQIIRVQVDANNFTLSQLLVISNGTQSAASYPQNEDYNFLAHKLLRDPNTRITAVNQIYEDWITRNFYTIVYVQRRLDHAAGHTTEPAMVTDRLVFRGTSIALLGADQLDYSVKAAAFITEKNGLHYYLEFLASNKFYLCAVDWSRRPFKMIDSRRFPIKATRTRLDNEELLLCPPAVCFANQPVDEIVSFGRIPLSAQLQSSVQRLTQASVGPKSPFQSTAKPLGVDGGDLLAGEPAIEEAAPIFGYQSDTPAPAPKTTAPPNANHSVSSVSLELLALIEAAKLDASQLDTKLHLRDWSWSLARKSWSRGLPISHNASRPAPFEANFKWSYESAHRNEVKAKPDTYGYVLTGHEIDASYRVFNELYLISANYLITINYTLANETVTSSHPISEEFHGLSSTLIDPITGAFYDRYTNQIYFFKGDRYVGYDYATKKPLEDFKLKPAESYQEPAISVEVGAEPLISSLPVVGILGMQHHVDGVFHDLYTDLVYIFSGMKFYTFEATNFKDGAFKTETNSLPQMQCINERFLAGCHFDEAYPNPCSAAEGTELTGAKDDAATHWEVEGVDDPPTSQRNETQRESAARLESDFTEEQQMKLRSIASRAGLLDILIENTLLNKGDAKLIDSSGAASDTGLQPDRVIVYLLVAMLGLTLMVTVAMIVVLLFWAKTKTTNADTSNQTSRTELGDSNGSLSSIGLQNSRTSHYLANQHQYHSRHQQPPQAPYRHSRHNQYLTSTRSRMAADPQTVEKALGSAVNVVVAKSRLRRSNDVVDNSAL